MTAVQLCSLHEYNARSRLLCCDPAAERNLMLSTERRHFLSDTFIIQSS